MGEGNREVLQVNFDGRIRLEFQGAKVTSDAGLLSYQELDVAARIDGRGRGTPAARSPHWSEHAVHRDGDRAACQVCDVSDCRGRDSPQAVPGDSATDRTAQTETTTARTGMMLSLVERFVNLQRDAETVRTGGY